MGTEEFISGEINKLLDKLPLAVIMRPPEIIRYFFNQPGRIAHRMTLSTIKVQKNR